MMKHGHSLQSGQDIGGYTLRKVLGKGNFGEVWEANASISEIVAIKQIVVKPGPLYQRQKKLIEEEIRIMQTAKHPNLVELREHFIEDDVYYLVMPVYDTDLAQYIQNCGGRISEERAVTFMKQLGMGFVELANHKIIHRDLKLENVLMDSVTCTLVISDFGLSSFGNDIAGSMVGTPIYTAPEVLNLGYGYNPSQIEYDSKVDIFSMGFCFYLMVMGEYPFDTRNSSKHTLANQMVQNVGRNLKFRPDVPVSDFIKQLMKEMTEIDPVKRIDWRDLLERLEQWKPEDYSKRELIQNNLKTVTPSMVLQGFHMQESIIFDRHKMKVQASFTECINQLRPEACKMDRFAETEAIFQSSWELTCKNYIELIKFLYEIPQRCKFIHQKQLEGSRSLGSYFLDCLEDLMLLVMVYLDRLIDSLVTTCTDNTQAVGFKQQKHDYFLCSQSCEKFIKELHSNQKILRLKFNDYKAWIQKVEEDTEFVSVPEFSISGYSKLSVGSLESFPVFSELMKAIKGCQEHLMEYTKKKILVDGSLAAKEMKIINAKLYILIHFEQELQLVATPTEQYDFLQEIGRDFLRDSHHYFEKANKSLKK